LSKRRDKNPQYVLKSDCKEIMGKIEAALWGANGRGGVVNDISDIKNKLTSLVEREAETKSKGRDWRLLGFAVLGSTITGAVLAAINYILTHLH